MTSRTAHATESKVADPDRGLHRHHLMPLVDSDSGALLDKLTADDANPPTDSVRSWSVAAAEGNPFYLRELVRHWVETQQSFGVPRSLAELIEARLNRLSSLGLRVLQLCAAFGKHSSFERLEQVTDYQNHTLLDAIEELSSAAMLAADAPGVTVKHDLLATAALNRLGDTVARLIHRQIAGVLEAEINEKYTASLMWDCAEHWQGAGDPGRALATVRLCAKHLYSVGQARQAIDLYEKALPICVTTNERLETFLGLAAALKSADQWSRLQLTLRDAQVAAENLPDAGFAVDHIHLLMLETGWRLNTPSQTRIEELARFAFDDSKQAVDRLQAIHLGLILCSENAREEDAHCLFRIVRQLEGNACQPALVAHIKMIFHADFGDLDQAVTHAQDLLDLHETIEEAGSVIRARTNAATCYRRAGRINEAKVLFEKTLDFATDHSLDAHAARSAVSLAFIALQEEDLASADRWHAVAATYAYAINERSCALSIQYIAARLGLYRGDLRAAREFVLSFEPISELANCLQHQCVSALRSEIQLAANGDILRADVEATARTFERSCTLGLHDFFALSLYRAWIAVGEPKIARDTLLRFVTQQRRERGPLSPPLAAQVALLAPD